MESHVFEIIKKEEERQKTTIELIASENFPSENVYKACGSVMGMKYCEGYPKVHNSGNNGRYYGGCENFDELENYCENKWLEAFAKNNPEVKSYNYHCNVQPHCGSSANMCAYASVLNIGDTILSMSMDAGAHLTHSSLASFVTKNYKVLTYGLKENGYIDTEDLLVSILLYHPKLILVGASAYPRYINFKEIWEIIQKAKYEINKLGIDYNPYFMADIAHIAGLVVAGVHPSPFPWCDIVTTTTHKTLRSARGGMIFCKPELASKVDSAVFPRNQGGPLMNMIAGKAVGAEEVCTEEFDSYIKDVVCNCAAMADEFIKLGYDLVTGGTDNHLLLIDFTKTHPTVTGAQIQEACDEAGITLNKNCVPNEKRSPKEASGIRIGTAAETTRGKTADDFREIARKIDAIIREVEKNNLITAK